MRESKPLFIFAMALFFSLLVGANAWYKENGIADVKELQGAIAEVDAKITAVKKANSRLRREERALRTSDAYVEAIARQSLGLVKPGEIVFEFVTAAPLEKSDPGEYR